MALSTGERYRCPDRECACEIEVVQGAPPGKGGSEPPRCCCGMPMEKISGPLRERMYET